MLAGRLRGSEASRLPHEGCGTGLLRRGAWPDLGGLGLIGGVGCADRDRSGDRESEPRSVKRSSPAWHRWTVGLNLSCSETALMVSIRGAALFRSQRLVSV